MKETGLIFKAPLVRAILSDQKTQTRRAFSKHMEKLMRTAAAAGEVSNFLDEGRLQPNDLGYVVDFCPLGKLGDRIYVRETWNWFDPQTIPADRAGPRAPFTGIADGKREIPWVAAFASDGPLPYRGYEGRDHWRPSIHMPKWAARIWLEVTGVRVKRLQQITEADCIAEGAPGGHGAIPDYQYSATPLEHFRHIWESTGGDWAANPWVWVIDFRTISTMGRPT